MSKRTGYRIRFTKTLTVTVLGKQYEGIAEFHVLGVPADSLAVAVQQIFEGGNKIVAILHYDTAVSDLGRYYDKDTSDLEYYE